MAGTLFRDLKIGLRVLPKERSFCVLAIVVLALGICGVTTMFSVVNGVMLRGFSFRTRTAPDERELHRSVDRQFLRRERRDQAMDYEEVAGRRSSLFELMAAYLNGSTVTSTYNGQAWRLHRRLHDRELLRCSASCRHGGVTLRQPTDTPGARRSRSSATPRGSVHRRHQASSEDAVASTANRHDHRRHAEGLSRLPTNEELWTRSQRVRAAAGATLRTANRLPAVLGLLRPA